MIKLIRHIIFGIYLIFIEIPLMLLGFALIMGILLIVGVILWLVDLVLLFKKENKHEK